jgi:hypothetical protein
LGEFVSIRYEVDENLLKPLFVTVNIFKILQVLLIYDQFCLDILLARQKLERAQTIVDDFG